MPLLQPAKTLGEMLVGAVGIELKAALKIRKLFIPLDSKNAKNSEFAQLRYTAGTRKYTGGLRAPRLRTLAAFEVRRVSLGASVVLVARRIANGRASSNVSNPQVRMN